MNCYLGHELVNCRIFQADTKLTDLTFSGRDTGGAGTRILAGIVSMIAVALAWRQSVDVRGVCEETLLSLFGFI